MYRLLRDCGHRSEKSSQRQSPPLLETLENRRLLSTTATLDFTGAAGGVDNTGFTGVLATSHGAGLITQNLTVGGGVLTVKTTSGDLVSSVNSQDDALDLNLDGTSDYTVQTQLGGLPFAANYQSGGIFVGTDQDNYVKLVAAYNGGPCLQLASEVNGVFTTIAQPSLSFSGISSLDLRLVGTASTNTLVAQYRVNSSSDSAWVTIGQVTTNTAAFSSSAKAGIVTTNIGSNSSVNVPFDSFTLVANNSAPPPTPITESLAVGPNVDATKLRGNEASPQIAINPTNPNNIVVVTTTDQSNGSYIPVARSFDGGATWTTTTIGPAQDGFPTLNQRVDARVAFDSYGNLYVSYMVASRHTGVCVMVTRSTNGGASFGSAIVAVSGSTYDPDSPSLTTGPDVNNRSRQAVYISFTDYNSNRIMIVGAISNGLGKLSSFSAPVDVSSAFGTYSSIAVGAKGQIAVGWQTNDSGQGLNYILVNTSTTGLDGFGTAGAATSTNVGGMQPIPAQPNRTVDANVGLAFDKSAGPASGRLYLVYADQITGPITNLDVFLRSSDSLGASWSSPVRINNDTGTNSQFLPALAVDPGTGAVGVSWLDARNSTANNTAQEYVAVSVDHGTTFASNTLISAGTSNEAWANQAIAYDFGDVGGLAFAGGKLIPAWADNSNSAGGNPNGANNDFDVYADVITVTA